MYSVSRMGDFEASNAALRQICGAYQLACDRWWEFRGSVSTCRIGTLAVADVTVSPCSVIRDHRDAHYLGDHLFLVFQAQGRAVMSQRGMEAHLEPGDSTIIDSRFPSVFHAPTGFRQYSFHLPPEPFRERFGKRPIPVAQTIRADLGAGRLLSDLLQSFVRNAPTLQGVELAGVTLQLLAAALDGNEAAALDLRYRSIEISDVVRYINAHIERTDLSPQMIADHLDISVRQLYRVVAADGCTPAALVWRKRLEHAHRLLTRCDARVPIIEIALNCGFKDGAHFSRAYRKMFGHSPRLSRSASDVTSVLMSEPHSSVLNTTP